MVNSLFFVDLHYFSYISVCLALVATVQTSAETINQLKIISNLSSFGGSCFSNVWIGCFYISDQPQHKTYTTHWQFKSTTLAMYKEMFCWGTLGPGIHVDATWHVPPSQRLLQTKYTPWFAMALPVGSDDAIWWTAKTARESPEERDKELKAMAQAPRFPRSQSDWESVRRTRPSRSNQHHNPQESKDLQGVSNGARHHRELVSMPLWVITESDPWLCLDW